jgi:hypothetical protein
MQQVWKRLQDFVCCSAAYLLNTIYLYLLISNRLGSNILYSVTKMLNIVTPQYLPCTAPPKSSSMKIPFLALAEIICYPSSLLCTHLTWLGTPSAISRLVASTRVSPCHATSPSLSRQIKASPDTYCMHVPCIVIHHVSCLCTVRPFRGVPRTMDYPPSHFMPRHLRPASCYHHY